MDKLILPGGEAWDAGENSKILESVKVSLAANIPVAAICGATAGLARAGILDDRDWGLSMEPCAFYTHLSRNKKAVVD